MRFIYNLLFPLLFPAVSSVANPTKATPKRPSHPGDSILSHLWYNDEILVPKPLRIWMTYDRLFLDTAQEGENGEAHTGKEWDLYIRIRGVKGLKHKELIEAYGEEPSSDDVDTSGFKLARFVFKEAADRINDALDIEKFYASSYLSSFSSEWLWFIEDGEPGLQFKISTANPDAAMRGFLSVAQELWYPAYIEDRPLGFRPYEYPQLAWWFGGSCWSQKMYTKGSRKDMHECGKPMLTENLREDIGELAWQELVHWYPNISGRKESMDVMEKNPANSKKHLRP